MRGTEGSAITGASAMTNDEHAEILRLIEKADSLWDVSEHLDRIAKRMEAGN